MTHPVRALLCLLFAITVLPAQADLQKKEADLDRAASGILLNFARMAQSQKVATRAKQAYDLIVERYDAENAAARTARGEKKVAGKWEMVGLKEKQPKWEDKANNEQRYKVVDEWSKVAKKLGDLHRTLGLELIKGEAAARGTFHLERAVYYYPLDKESHLALGHLEHEGFFGTEEEVAFVKKMREIETKALDLAKLQYEVTPLPDTELPEELKKLNLEFHGAKSQNFTVWCRGSQENADNCVQWGERAISFLEFLVGPERAKKMAVARRGALFGFQAFLWTGKERDDFLKENPQVYEGKTLEEAKSFANVGWQVKGRPVNVSVMLMPPQRHDSMIVNVFKYGIGNGANNALAEGLQHAAAWYLQSTSITKFGALPEGTQGRKELALPESTNWWMRKIRDDAISGADWPLNQVPRERLSSFRNDVRIKAWSFMTWVVARYPDKWVDFFLKVPADKIPFPEEIDKACEETLGKPLTEVESQWREWARGDSGVAAATGYGPPLLPEKPNREELAALERMNAVRAANSALSWPENKWTDSTIGPLTPTDLDAEASMACEAHASFLCKWPKEHLRWPEAHEENPALEGFTPRGMRAGMRSVIIWREGSADADWSRDSVDGWMGTVYHRFPLLEHNIYRFGFAYVVEQGYSVGVLDMGSLEEPYDPTKAPRLVAWPPPDMKEVPRQFHGIEQPNPLDDQPENQRDITKTGYPVSLQFQRELAGQLSEASVLLYELKTGKGKVPTKYLVQEDSKEHNEWKARRGEPAAWVLVPIWIHTPMEPLLKHLEEKEVVFAIPKDHLRAKTTYQAEVRFNLGGGGGAALCCVWEFTTGSQMQGLKF